MIEAKSSTIRDTDNDPTTAINVQKQKTDSASAMWIGQKVRIQDPGNNNSAVRSVAKHG
jgi:hypothetical protein